MTTNEIDFQFIPNRELRIIPKGWQHPKDETGTYVPLCPEGSPSGASRTMPSTSELRESQAQVVAYETESAGTPISPPFPNTPDGCTDLVAYCARQATIADDRKADEETWAYVLFDRAVITVNADGSVRLQD